MAENNMHHRRVALAPILSLILIMAFFTLPANAQKQSIGTVTRVQGEAMIGGNPAAVSNPVFSGNTITTGTEGRLEVTFHDATVLTVGGNSEFLIDTYSYNTDTPTKEAILKLTKGAFRAVTSSLIDVAPENFKVITPLATIGIRGTDFWGGFLSAETLDVTMLKGKGVTVATPGGVLVIEKAGYGVTVKDPTLPPQKYQKWKPAKLNRAIATIDFK